VQERFNKHINNHLGFLNQKKLLIAVSGGLDSVLLTHLCKAAKLNIALAHCNFNLRDSESDGDEASVLGLAKALELEVFIQHFDTTNYAEVNKLSIQMAARELRYNWFQELASQLDFDYILTAHHADDNLETFLINLSRGTGLDGLIGIPETNGNIVRPLLKFSRIALEHYAKKMNITWREDSSNASIKYLRNQLRHEVIPKLKETNPNFLQNFDTTLQHLKQASNIVEESVNAVLKRAIVEVNNDEVTYDISTLLALKNNKSYLVEIFKPYGFTAFKDIFNLLEAQSGKQIFSQSHRLIKDRTHLILAKLTLDKSVNIVINTEDKDKTLPIGILFFDETNAIEATSKNEIYLDAKLISYPLTVRNWQEGDYFYPLGLNGKKKISKFFKDEKLNILEKEKCLVLCTNKEIVWVVGYRADHRFRVAKTTTNILKISLVKNT
jgi:tRNA(Ile)-lysidine synthase